LVISNRPIPLTVTTITATAAFTFFSTVQVSLITAGKVGPPVDVSRIPLIVAGVRLFAGRMLFLSPNQQHESAAGILLKAFY